ncbi:hypothetical protein WMF37_05700 [Sorangium sp. So ce291]|uniref:hypothetical protein n=1 Tax=Sorangium sp. So ce291 TaxID=3133294 RepID=UPI003F5E019F
MKTVMQSATTSGDGAKIASALEYVASKPHHGDGFRLQHHSRGIRDVGRRRKQRSHQVR